MPLKRYDIRNEYSLADPQLYKVADKDDPEALLEGIAMAGLVGVLRQLGDLAQFAAEIFHDLHEEVMGTAARGHGLIFRIQQLEAEFPLVETKLLSQTNHSSFLYKSSIDWHPNLSMGQNKVTQGDMPRFVMDSYEECRGPPRLFLLDKFDVAGAGACLKRFTDPSFFKVKYASSTARKPENQREKKTQRIKKREPRWRIVDTPVSYPSSHAKLHQLFLEEHIESGGNDPDRHVKLKKRHFTGSLFAQESVKRYMEKFLDNCPPEQRVVHETVEQLPLTCNSNHASDSGLEMVEIGTVKSLKESMEFEKELYFSPDTKSIAFRSSLNGFVNEFNNGKHTSALVQTLELPWKSHNGDILSTTEVVSSKNLIDNESNSESCVDDNTAADSDDVASGIDDYVDALATIESEVETDSESKKHPSYFNMKPVAADSDGRLGQQDHYGGFLYSQSISASSTSEDGKKIYEEKEILSCSNSVNASVGTTLDSDAVAVAVPPVTASYAEREKFSDHHNESEEFFERDYVCAKASTADNKAQQEYKVSNVKCLTKVLSVDIGGHLMEKSLESDDTYCNFADSGVTPGKWDPRHSDAHNWSSSATVLDAPDKIESEHWSAKLPIRDKTGFISGVCSETSSHPQKTSDALTNSPQLESQNVNLVYSSSADHTMDTEIRDVGGFCSEFTQSPEQSAISGSELPGLVNPVCDFASVPCSQDSVIRVSSGPIDHERRVSSDSTACHGELYPLFGNDVQFFSPELPSTRINESGEIAVCGSFEADGAVYGDLPNSDKSLGCGDGKTVDSVMIGSENFSVDPLETEAMNLKLSLEIDDAPSFLHFQVEGGEKHPESDIVMEQISVPICEDKSKAGISVQDGVAYTCPGQTTIVQSLGYSDGPEMDTADRILSSENTPNDFLGDDSIYSIDTSLSGYSCNQADDFIFVDAAENDADAVSDVEKLKLVPTVVQCPAAILDHYQSVIPSFSSTACPEKLPHSTTEDFHQTEYESIKRLRGSLNEYDSNTGQYALVNSNSHPCTLSSDVCPSVLPHSELTENYDNAFHRIHLFEDKNKCVDAHSHDILKPVLPLKAVGVAEDIMSDGKSLLVHGVPPEASIRDMHVQNPEGVKNEGWIDDSAPCNQSEPSVSKPPPQTVHQTLGSARVAMLHSNMGNSHRPTDVIDLTQLEDHEQQVCLPDSLDVVSEASESQLNLEPPHLPPLPPLQWRLGRFQNSSASPERQMLHQRVGHVQARPVILPALNHSMAPVQTMSLAAVHNSLAPAQPIALPAGQYILAPAQPMTLPVQLHALAPVAQVILPNEPMTVGRTSRVDGHPGSLDGFMTQEGTSLPLITEGSSVSASSASEKSDNLISTVPSTCGYMPLQGGFTLPMPAATVSESSSQGNQLFFVHSTSEDSQRGSDVFEKLQNPNGGPPGSESFNRSYTPEDNVSMEEAIANVDVGAQIGLLNPQVTEQGMVNSFLQFLPSSRVPPQPSAGFVASEADRAWLSTYNGVPTLAANNTTEASQKKLLRPRNPLIHEVVAIDKSKLRKVERFKPALVSKLEEGESLREQMQLRKVDKLMPAVGTKAPDEGSGLEQLQLRKVVSSPTESDGRELLPEQLKLRQVRDRVKSKLEMRVEELQLPRVQLRKINQRLKQEVETKIEETESPRVQLRKVGVKSQSVAAPIEERDSLFEQIRNKSFNLKPAVAARANIQGPRTNLKVAAILEKASNIRQAMVGSDEEDDADTWE